ncbi:MAG TPA: GNAT family N-acetyltransferase [Longimicrobiaceae bacterium]|nr:GNAT family N-acetyltransferase [Longimicrobiaceae bacterium]
MDGSLPGTFTCRAAMATNEPDGVVFERADATRTELLVEMMREFYAFEHLPWDEEAARRGLGMILEDGSLGEVWLIRRGGAMAGYFVLAFGFSLEFRGRDAFLDEIYIREEHRGGGLGRGAIRKAEEVCRARGVRALHLEVERKNTGAQAFYRTLGFEDHDRYLLTKWVSNPVQEAH